VSAAGPGGCVDPDIRARMIELRRDVHRHPELSGAERRTAVRVVRALAGWKVPHRMELDETAVIAELPGPAGVPSVALRADLDALPLREETGLTFASEREGVMHACGHDAHAAMLVGAAALLSREDGLPAPVRFLFQPAEETAAGARALIAAGALDGVGAIFGGHVDAGHPVGRILVTEGVVNASTDQFRALIHGRSAHGARPEEGVDALVVASLVVTAMQSVVARVVAPDSPAVVTVGRMEAGTAANVIAGRAELEGTIRALDEETRARVKGEVERVVTTVGELLGATAELEFGASTPPVRNSSEMVRMARQAASEVVGERGVSAMARPNLGGEDFGAYLQRVPGCFVRFAAGPSAGGGAPQHSSRFDVEEAVLPIGAAYFRAIALAAGAALAAGDGRII